MILTYCNIKCPVSVSDIKARVKSCRVMAVC